MDRPYVAARRPIHSRTDRCFWVRLHLSENRAACEDKPELVLEHSLKNTGKKTIEPACT